jgi:hypothetical protein
MNNNNATQLGIDVSKFKLDVALLLPTSCLIEKDTGEEFCQEAEPFVDS